MPVVSAKNTITLDFEIDPFEFPVLTETHPQSLRSPLLSSQKFQALPYVILSTDSSNTSLPPVYSTFKPTGPLFLAVMKSRLFGPNQLLSEDTVLKPTPVPARLEATPISPPWTLLAMASGLCLTMLSTLLGGRPQAPL
jgi:hypothetical protein